MSVQPTEMQAAYLLITFLTAFFVTYINLYNSEKFHNLFFLIYKNATVLLYCLLYGLIGIGLYLLLRDSALKIIDNNTRVGTGLLYAFGVGISTKAVSDFNLFNIKSGTTTIPIGIKTVTEQLDRFFEQRFDAVCFVRYYDFLEPYQKVYRSRIADVVPFKKETLAKLSQYHPDKRKVAAFAASESFSRISGTDEILSLILKEFGVLIFKKIFVP